MIKKEYMKPEMEVVKIQQQCQILAGSNEGLNDNLQPARARSTAHKITRHRVCLISSVLCFTLQRYNYYSRLVAAQQENLFNQ